jgi:chromosome segregation ATPase
MSSPRRENLLAQYHQPIAILLDNIESIAVVDKKKSKHIAHLNAAKKTLQKAMQDGSINSQIHLLKALQTCNKALDHSSKFNSSIKKSYLEELKAYIENFKTLIREHKNLQNFNHTNSLLQDHISSQAKTILALENKLQISQRDNAALIENLGDTKIQLGKALSCEANEFAHLYQRLQEQLHDYHVLEETRREDLIDFDKKITQLTAEFKNNLAQTEQALANANNQIGSLTDINNDYLLKLHALKNASPRSAQSSPANNPNTLFTSPKGVKPVNIINQPEFSTSPTSP